MFYFYFKIKIMCHYLVNYKGMVASSVQYSLEKYHFTYLLMSEKSITYTDHSVYCCFTRRMPSILMKVQWTQITKCYYNNNIVLAYRI